VGEGLHDGRMGIVVKVVWKGNVYYWGGGPWGENATGQNLRWLPGESKLLLGEFPFPPLGKAKGTKGASFESALT